MKEGAVGGWLLLAGAFVAASWLMDGGATVLWDNGRGWINETLNTEHFACGDPMAVKWRDIWTNAMATWLAWPNAIAEYFMWSDPVRYNTYTYVGLASIEAPPWASEMRWPLGYVVCAIWEPLVHIFRVTWLLAVRFGVCDSDRALTAMFFVVFVVMVFVPNLLLCVLTRLFATRPMQQAVKYWEK